MRKEIIAATRRLDRPTQYALNLLAWARLDKAHAEFVGELPGIAQQLSALERRQHVGSVANGAIRLDGKPLRDQPLPAACLGRSEEHTSELQSLMRISYAVFCLKKKNSNTNTIT